MLSILAVAALTLTPWKGTDLPTATLAAAKYRLTIAGQPGQVVHLHTAGVADGWIAAFCDMKVCSPSQLTETIPKSGSVVVQFELIRETEDAPHSSGAIIRSDDGRTIIVPHASR